MAHALDAQTRNGQPGARCVVVYRSGDAARPEHDHATCSAIARKLAHIHGWTFGGDYDAHAKYERPLYFVPMDTLVGIDHARTLGIASEHDLFGGVVPDPFVATKSISHPLIDDHVRAPPRWCFEFARLVPDAVLPGFTAFSVADAQRAADRLFAHGPVRAKRTLGIGGTGQSVIANQAELNHVLDEVDADEIATYGIALEQHLSDVKTYSVGQVRVDSLVATYCGVQRTTPNNEGESVYGGSDLTLVRGDFDALLALEQTEDARRAIAQARAYDDAAFRCFAGLMASRRNYDVARGMDASGRARSGVLEQSWRIGGASGAEVEALAAFRADASLRIVRAVSTELYGPDVVVPAAAALYFQGSDERTGPLTKYTTIEPYGDA